MEPTVGRIVNYQSYGTPNGEYKALPRAAIVTAVQEDTISLCIFNPTGLFFPEKVPHSEEPKPGHWSWPEINKEIRR